MWRKSENEKSASDSLSELKPASNSMPQSATAATGAASTGRAVVNQGIVIKGEISGQGDFFFDGTFEGKVHLPEGSFTAGPHAHVTAEIEAREIVVQGEVVGTLKARERVHIFSTGQLSGDMDTRGIVIEDGAILHSKVATPRMAASQPVSAKAAAPAVTSGNSAIKSAETTETAQLSSEAKESPRTKGAAAGDS